MLAYLNPISFIYNEVLWRPLFNLLVFIYGILPVEDLGLAVLVFGVLLRLAFTPLMLKAQHAQKEMAAMQPEIARIQKEFKDNREGQSKAMMELYGERKVNPFSGCVFGILQALILYIIPLSIFRHVFESSFLDYVYPFMARPESISSIGFGLIDLSHGNMYFGAIAAVTLFVQNKYFSPLPPAQGGEFAKVMQVQMVYMVPVIIFVSSLSFPASLMLYWTILNIIGIVQEIIIKK